MLRIGGGGGGGIVRLPNIVVKFNDRFGLHTVYGGLGIVYRVE